MPCLRFLLSCVTSFCYNPFKFREKANDKVYQIQFTMFNNALWTLLVSLDNLIIWLNSDAGWPFDFGDSLVFTLVTFIMLFQSGRYVDLLQKWDQLKTYYRELMAQNQQIMAQNQQLQAQNQQLQAHLGFLLQAQGPGGDH